MNVLDIKSPKDIKNLNSNELKQLAQDIRNFLVDSVSKTGGHLSSNLGIVEITIALHYVFNAPVDKLLFDVGHQSYIHKILTGRANKMDHLRQFGGISGFQKRNESEYDCFEAGHSSTALSTALGMAIARDLNNENYQVIPVVGDASIMSGISLEALNNIGYKKRKMIIVFNDNNMSINKSVGALKKSFKDLRMNESYLDFREGVKESLNHDKFGINLQHFISKVKKRLKKNLINSGVFKEFDIDYIGPIDGHNIDELIKAFKAASLKDGPVVVHCITTKGKGYKFAEGDRSGKWHGVGKFDPVTGQSLSSLKDGYKDYSSIVADTVENIMEKDDRVVCITPAMISGSKLNNIFNKYPERSFDVGIAEEHAVLFASGLSLSGKMPFVSIYSSFLQRAYDELNHDISRMDLPCVFGIDRAGIVGADGETHNGVFDISFLRPLPNVIICQGKNSVEIENLIYTGFKQKHPYFIRYPRGNIEYTKSFKYQEIPVGKWEILDNNNLSDFKAYIITYGEDVIRIQDYIKSHNLPLKVINARFIKPIDKELLTKIYKENKPVYVYTTDILKGGLGDEILEFYNRYKKHPKITIMGIDDIFVKHGDVELVKKSLNIDIDSLFAIIKKDLNA